LIEIIVRIIRKDRSLIRPQRYCTIVELESLEFKNYKSRLTMIVIGVKTIVAPDIADFMATTFFSSSILLDLL
jgi:hypothetical protein